MKWPTRQTAERAMLVVAGVSVLGLGIAFTRGIACSRPGTAPTQTTGSEPSRGPTSSARPRNATLPPLLRPAPTPAATPAIAIPPAFSALLGSPQIDPRRTDYDPVAAYELGGGGNVRDLFLSEPRADPWAGEREADLGHLLLPELQAVDPDVRVEAECRTATCRIRLYSQVPSLMESFGEYPLSCLASKTALMSGTSVPVAPDAEEPVPSFFLVFRRETLDRAAFLSWIGDMCPRDREEWRRMAGERRQ